MFTLLWTLTSQQMYLGHRVGSVPCISLQPNLGRTSSGKKSRSAQVTKQNTDGGRVFLAFCVWNKFMYLSYLNDFRFTVLNL